MYIYQLLEDKHKKVSTARRHLSAIIDSHRRAGLPVPSMALARKRAAVIRQKRREQPNRKAALSIEVLRRMVDSCDTSTATGCRDRAIIVLGFATALRRSELAALQLSDVSFLPEGLGVFIGKAKNDQTGKGRDLGVWPGSHEATDPYSAVKDWVAKRGDWEGPLFIGMRQRVVKPGSEALEGSTIALVIKNAAKRAGINPSIYSGHSLRSGFVTASGGIGRSELEITKTTGHVSTKEVKTYFRNTGIFLGRNPLEGLL